MDGGGLGQLQVVLIVLSQDRLPVHGVPRPVNRAVGIDVGGPAAAGGTGKRPGAGSDRGEFPVRGGYHPQVVLLRSACFGVELGYSILIRAGARLFLFAKAKPDIDVRLRSSALPIDHIGQHASAAGAGDQHYPADHQQGVGLVMTVGGLDQVKTGGQRVDGQLLRIGDVGGRHCLPPPCYQLFIVEQRNLGKLGDPDDAAAAGQRRLPGAQVVAGLNRKLAAEETANQVPKMVLPIVKSLQPCPLVNSFFRSPGRSVGEAVQIAQIAKKLFRIVNAVDTELQLIHIMRIKVNRQFFIRREGTAGAQVEGDGFGSVSRRGDQEGKGQTGRSQKLYSPSRSTFHR